MLLRHRPLPLQRTRSGLFRTPETSDVARLRVVPDRRLARANLLADPPILAFNSLGEAAEKTRGFHLFLTVIRTQRFAGLLKGIACPTRITEGFADAQTVKLHILTYDVSHLRQRERFVLPRTPPVGPEPDLLLRTRETGIIQPVHGHLQGRDTRREAPVRMGFFVPPTSFRVLPGRFDVLLQKCVSDGREILLERQLPHLELMKLLPFHLCEVQWEIADPCARFLGLAVGCRRQSSLTRGIIARRRGHAARVIEHDGDHLALAGLSRPGPPHGDEQHAEGA